MNEQGADKPDLDLWVEERHRGIFAARYRAAKTLFSKQSRYQRVDVIESSGFGRMLFNDGVAMVSERDEFVYHEMIAHVPLFCHRCPKRVLVIGGGDGGTVREVLKHPSVEHCRLVEIDEVVLKACEQFIPATAASLRDPRVEVTVRDATKFVAEMRETWDVILVDSSDPVGPARPLFGADFYRNLQSRLAPGGIVVSQADSPFYEPESQRSLLEILSRFFRRTHLYNYSNLTYPGGLWSFSFASQERCPLADFDSDRMRASAAPLSYYSEHIHRAAFVLPEFQRLALGELLHALPL